MTTIAYKDGILACDSAWSADSKMVAWQNKITRFKTGALYASCGDGDDRQLVRLLRKVKSPSKIPSTKALRKMDPSDIEALLIFKSGDVWLLWTGPTGGAFPITPPSAIGSGRNFALGAMDAGLSAEDAVKVACQRDCHSRLPVYTESLK